MIGSDSDLPQCVDGFKILKEAESLGKAQVVVVFTNSIHRNRKATLKNLRALTRQNADDKVWVEVWVIGAGKANQLTGMCESELRYELRNDVAHVIGVAFRGKTRQSTLAAILSIIEVPGNQVIFDRKRHVGRKGFANACYDAVYADLPEIKLPAPKPTATRTLIAAISAANEMLKK